jgi:hypothetical protein
MVANTTFAAAGPSPILTIKCRAHSNATRAAATRGARTRVLGALSIPTCSNSLCSGGNIAAVALIASAKSADTRFTTISRVASMLRTVSFRTPSRLFTGTNINVGGFAVTPLKNENGAKLVTPSGDIVETQAIGRGVIVEINQR